MIKEIITQAAIEHGFSPDESLPTYPRVENSKLDESINNISFFSQIDKDRKRFLVILETDTIHTPEKINNLALQSAPESFKTDPAFDKNTDLIIIHRLDLRADFKKIEQSVFNIEENPFYFKKYFLYYSTEEESLLSQHNFTDLSTLIKDTALFEKYSESPLTPSKYSITARIFIKTPFIKTPTKESTLKPLDTYVKEALSEKNLLSMHTKIAHTIQAQYNQDELIKELINEELENS